MGENIGQISKIKMCSACGACISVCPTKSISLKESSIGRIYATVDSKCINCGKCLSVCPSYAVDYEFDSFFCLDKYKVAVGKATDSVIRSNGQSGGVVTAILSYLFAAGKIDAALVCKSDERGFAIPYVATKVSQLEQCQKSIYTPVPLLTKIDTLKVFKSVAVVGLPCHISALCKLQKYNRLPISYKLGLICDRNLCGAISDSICAYLQLGESESVSIRWRDKNAQGYSYHNAPIIVTSSNDKVSIIPSTVRQGIKKYFTPPRCLVCPDKMNISADLVMGDPWNIQIDDTRGENLIVANSLHGYELLKQALDAGSIIYKECTSSQLDKSQHIKERRYQVSVYSRVLSKFIKNNSFLLNQNINEKISFIEQMRALYNILRFSLFEILPKEIVYKYISKKISDLYDTKDK